VRARVRSVSEFEGDINLKLAKTNWIEVLPEPEPDRPSSQESSIYRVFHLQNSLNRSIWNRIHSCGGPSQEDASFEC
jgi:hypothetical protein